LAIFRTGNGLAYKILSGWPLDGVYPYTSGSDFSSSTGNGLRRSRPGRRPVLGGERPSAITDQYSQGGTAADPNSYFQPTTSAGTAGIQSSASRNHQLPAGPRRILRPRRVVSQLGAFKDFRINERMKFTFRWEQYDTVNHPN